MNGGSRSTGERFSFACRLRTLKTRAAQTLIALLPTLLIAVGCGTPADTRDPIPTVSAETDPVMISWSSVIELMRQCQVSSVFRPHYGPITVTLTDGRTFQVTPRPADVLYDTQAHAPPECPVRFWTE
jgi:hypothetical protein